MASGNDSFDEQCALYNRNNKSGPIEIKNPYGGIPQNLLTNVIGLSILILVSVNMRLTIAYKKDCTRTRLVHDRNVRCTLIDTEHAENARCCESIYLRILLMT